MVYVSDEQIAAYKKDGYLIVPAFLDQDESAAALEGFCECRVLTALLPPRPCRMPAPLPAGLMQHTDAGGRLGPAACCLSPAGAARRADDNFAGPYDDWIEQGGKPTSNPFCSGEFWVDSDRLLVITTLQPTRSRAPTGGSPPIRARPAVPRPSSLGATSSRARPVRHFPLSPCFSPLFREVFVRVWTHFRSSLWTGGLNLCTVHPDLIDACERIIGTTNIRLCEAHCGIKYAMADGW